MLKNIALGGVFDRLHEGHKYIIKEAIDRGENVYVILIGRGDAETHPDKDVHSIQSFEVREKALRDYLAEVDKDKKVTLKLSQEGVGVSPFLAWEILWKLEDLTWFQVEEDTIAQRIFDLVTKERKKKFGLPPLKVKWIPSLKKNGKKISASDIRRKK